MIYLLDKQCGVLKIWKFFFYQKHLFQFSRFYNKSRSCNWFCKILSKYESKCV